MSSYRMRIYQSWDLAFRGYVVGGRWSDFDGSESPPITPDVVQVGGRLEADGRDWVVVSKDPTDEPGVFSLVVACAGCKGRGMRVGEGHGQPPSGIDPDDGWLAVQRCDACEVFGDDEQAARAYLARYEGGGDLFLPLADDGMMLRGGDDIYVRTADRKA